MILKNSQASKKWQIVIPRAARKRWNITEPSAVRFTLSWTKHDTLELKPEKKLSWRDLVGSLTGKAIRPYKPEDDDYGDAVVKEVLGEL